jgi:hypothetical protein
MFFSVQTHKIYGHLATRLTKMNGWMIIWSRQLPQGFSSTKRYCICVQKKEREEVLYLICTIRPNALAIPRAPL